ncbi:M15 family metallopeptidase [Thermoflavimicrobium dichotomicum]|uniref:D-alanyl-D-alanine dipeptidase n=1 Tax=Thermoflavimicrobium dichotomicum TaxID=46223 RepID=A0A1I3SAZ5_9BACL|nr:M15 family metallopeptidase [Thermoflavimicrobium dichotomicum]SFJ54711.1 D-alanyl-D-alanine dipeptidase [Thermoflavimicrobium dichotomicum]
MEKYKKILMSDSIVSSIHVETSQEPFVDLINFDSDILVDQSQSQIASKSVFFSFVRLSVAEKLVAAKRFLPKGIHFYVKEGYRPLSVQQHAFERTLKKLEQSFPHFQQVDLIAEAAKYVAPPEVAPHPTGGAVDLTLIDSNGIELDLGTRFNASPHDTDNATYTDATNIPLHARENRQILSNALQAVGFVNYFTEWWHWSLGDRYWAVMTNAKKALYNPVSEQELSDLLHRTVT